MTFILKCVGYNSSERRFTIGKTYEFKDGNFYNDRGFNYKHWDESNSTPDGVIEWFSRWYKFELVTDIKRVIFNDPATVILWNDGTKTVAKCVKGDKYDPEKGFAIAYAKKFGGKTFREEMDKWCAPVVDVKAKSDPLTMDELMKMDGKRVWLSSIYAGEENFDDCYCGWHTVDVRKGRVDDDDGYGYCISEMGNDFGYRAYLTPQTGKKG